MSSAYYDTNQPYSHYESSSTLASIQDELEENKDLVKENIEKIIHRDQLILNIEEQSENLSENSNLFKTKSTKLANKVWYQAYMCELILIAITIIIIIILLSVLLRKH